MTTPTETFSCELHIPGRKSALTFRRDIDAREDAWFAPTTGRGGFALSAANTQGLMRIYPIVARSGMPGAPLTGWVREVTADGSPRLELVK